VNLGQLYGLEKFWAFLKYSRRDVTTDPRLKNWLSKYQRLEDFRIDVSQLIVFQFFSEVINICGILANRSQKMLHFIILKAVAV
jgi:hypothetical protein